MIYLDHNATSPLRPEAKAAVTRALEIGGNPSSVHAAGRTARAIVEDAREAVAAFAGAVPGEVIFTSGGAEANALALRGAIAGAAESGEPVTRLLVQATAHDSVRAVAASFAETFPGLEVTEIPVEANGTIGQAALRAELTSRNGRALVSLIYVNNETGVIEDIAALVKLIRDETDALIHVDAVSSGTCPIQFAEWDAEYLSLSAHKLGGPQGVGALIAKDGAPLAPLFNGFQELRRRGGTENVSGIAGFGAAVRVLQSSREGEAARITTIRDQFEKALSGLSAITFGDGEERAANTSCFAIPGLSAETSLMALDLDGICVSSGAACSSGKVGRSHVLKAMGVSDELARCALRVTFGWNSCAEDADAAIASLEKLITRISARKAA
ncbi:MAG TPA: cysteine desulfurase family protein [Rhizomicrobium sp.]|jgi:cysteine desulfurase|nr:cysteine desulfurase family protein [Rhizomicrobium sp.]